MSGSFLVAVHFLYLNGRKETRMVLIAALTFLCWGVFLVGYGFGLRGHSEWAQLIMFIGTLLVLIALVMTAALRFLV